MSDEGESEEPIGLGKTLSSLTPPIPPPTLEDGLRRLVALHGADAVKAGLKAIAKKPRGRVPEKDWALLRDDFIQDARDWLEGRDPNRRSNYSIAQRVSLQFPGHSAPATFRRIQRKLAAKRYSFMLYTAFGLSADEYPFEAHFRTCEALADLKGEDDVWLKILEMDRVVLERYRELHGEPPPNMTWKEIEKAPRFRANSIGSLLSLPPAGMFGSSDTVGLASKIPPLTT